MYKSYFKRFFDVFIACIIILITFPIVFIFAMLIALESKGPVFFKQERLGKNSKLFTLYKLRSLKVNEHRIENQIFKEHPDMTPTGKFIRRFKIDELPQIFNILRGDMSLVGPRPCLPSLKEKFDENAYFRLEVKPGLTGWAQVNGNINNSWPIRWKFDRYYVENISFMLDMKILYKTVFVLIFGD